MKKRNQLVLTFALVALLMGILSAQVRAAPPVQGGTGLDAADAATMLNAHNSWRQRYSVPALVWDPTVAAVAQDWANQMAASGNFAHRPNNQYGENIWAGTSGFFVPGDAVNSWGSEVENYSFVTNSCADGKTCGHFTQLVWARTARVGCGKATGSGNDYYVCNYDPPGNFVGQTTGASPAAALATLQPTEQPTATAQAAGAQPTATQAAATTTAATTAATAQPALKGTTGLSIENANALLDAHNTLRAKYHAPALNWDDTVAAFAQSWADQIAAAGGTFSIPTNNHYGVNFFFGSESGDPASAVNWWAQSANDYDLTTNTCADGKNCRSFTQAVWSNSTKLGCGRAVANGNAYYICNYDPAGNVSGQTPGISLVATAPAPTQTATLAPTATLTVTTTITATATLTATTSVTTTAALTETLTPTAAPSATVTATLAARTTTNLNTVDAGAMLDAHNSWRQRYNVPAVVWDDAVAAVAQDWANQIALSGNFGHRPNNRYGENIWAGSTGFFVATDAVNSWGSEVENYNFDANTCADGKVCGHFTQLVWANTTKIGCGKATGNGNDYIVCNYDPPGNFTGERPGASPAKAIATVQPTEQPTATPQPVANAPVNTDPNGAIPFDTQNLTIPGSASLWYTFPAPPNGDNVTIRIPRGAANALGFWVFAPSQMADLSNATHIGAGNVEGEDLVWTGNSGETEPYFIVVFNNTTVPVAFEIQTQ